MAGTEIMKDFAIVIFGMIAGGIIAGCLMEIMFLFVPVPGTCAQLIIGGSFGILGSVLGAIMAMKLLEKT